MFAWSDYAVFCAGVKTTAQKSSQCISNLSKPLGVSQYLNLLVHGQLTIIFVVSVCLFVCAEFFSAVFDPIWIKVGHMLHVRV